jgi:TRAP-type C4-dicarboxylate transport system permease small subunit
MLKKIESLFVKLAWLMNSIAAAGLFTIMAVVVLNILMRVLFNRPFMGTYEIVQYGLLLAVSLALADNELADGNVMVSYFLEKMKPKTANIFNIFTGGLGILVMGFVTWNQWRMILQKFNNKASSSILKLPHWIIVLVLTLGFFTLFIALTVKLMRLVSRHKSLPDVRLTDEERLRQMEARPDANY